MPRSFASLHHHLILSTRHRAPILDGDLLPRLYQYIGGILRAGGGVLVAAGGTADHVHLLASLSRETAVAEVLRVIKTNSSKWIHELDPARGGFAWQSGYGAFAVSYSHLERVKAYLAGQAEHHRTMTFQEEFRAFLERHHIEFDERYLWD
jgi:REP element-mobilizing transposase RayT